MHIFFDNFHHGEKYTAQIGSHQAELRKDEIFTDQKSWSITSLHTDYLNLGRSSGSSRINERVNLVQKNALFVEVLTILHKNALKI